MSQTAEPKRVRRRRAEPLLEEEYQSNFQSIVELGRIALSLQEQKLLADFERRAFFAKRRD